MKMFQYLPLLLFISCTNINHLEVTTPVRILSSSRVEQPVIEQEEVWGKEEFNHLTVIGNIFKNTLIETTGSNTLMKRDAHPKHHGCVNSILEIDNKNLTEDLKVGIFKNNQNYSGIVRFSNGDPNSNKPDADRDIRGMALKLYDVPYETYLHKLGIDTENDHDFVFMNADAFFIDNPYSYRKFMEATKGRFGVLSYLATHWTSTLRILSAMEQPGNPLDLDYRSATPYKLGNTSMKMKFKSCKEHKDLTPEKPSENFLGETLEKYLLTNNECFEFYIQPNKEPKKNNIENAMVIWDETKSPFVKVGTLKILKQSGFRTKEKMDFCENMSFNPWRSPIENRPLGGVNRIRLEVYLNQSKLRHDYNGIK